MEFLSREENEKFLGTGENNALGQNLFEFLENYDPHKYLNPSNTVDILVFSYKNINGANRISKLLLIRRGNHPCIGMWATPGGFIEFRESIDAAAKRELAEETGIDDIEIEQLKSYGEYDRDPRTRIITTAYVALVPEGKVHAQAGDDAKDAEWFDISWKESDGAVYTGLDGRCHRTLELKLEAEKRGITLGAKVDKSFNSGAALKNVKYELIESNGIAADHGAIIMEAAEYVKDKL